MLTDLTEGYSQKRWWCALALCVLVVVGFWSTSRYPDLFEELQRSNTDTLLERNVGAISKTEMMNTSSQQSVQERVFKTSVNWIETNAKGMTFGILFGSCLLVLLGQTSWIRNQSRQSGLGALLSGVALGTPLGVCTNCATPIGLSMYRSGIRLETVLATMVASPTLNPIGLIIVFSVFPLSMALLKLASAMIIVLLGIPLLLRLFGRKVPAPAEVCALPAATPDAGKLESWPDAVQATLRLLMFHLWFIIKWTVPFMLVVAVIGALIVSYFPLEQLLFLRVTDASAIVAAAMIGALLPTPMFVDIVLVLSLLSFGMASGPATALLVSLGPVSIYASIIIWRQVSRGIAVTLLLIGASLGMVGGLAQNYIDQKDNSGTITAGQPMFRVAMTHDFSEPEIIDPLYSVQNFIHAGASWGDYDGDGDDDIWVSSARGGRLYRNDGANVFEDATTAADLTVFPQSSSGLWADYDGDGDQDLLVLYYGFLRDYNWYQHSNMLFRNEGDGTFAEVTRASGLFFPNHTTAAAWGDYDNDGDLDVYISNYGTMVAEATADAAYDVQFVKGEPNQLFRNNGDGTFTDVAQAAGVAGEDALTRGTYSAMVQGRDSQMAAECFCSFQPLWFDFDNDGDQDLFVANDFGTSLLYRNEGDGSFTDITVAAGVSKYSTGMGVAVTDINHDGYLDLYETTIEDNPLWINNGDGTFKRTRISRMLDDRERFGWGVAFLDFDNDSREDLLVANGLTATGDIQRVEEYRFSTRNINSLYRNLGNDEYVNVLQKSGLASSLVSRGLAVSDYNLDGYPDVYLTHKVGENVLYANAGGPNNWITVKLRGTRSNRDGIGATVTVISNGVANTQLITAGSSYASQHSLWRTFGLGAAERADKIIVKWPGGETQELLDVVGRQRLLIEEPVAP